MIHSKCSLYCTSQGPDSSRISMQVTCPQKTDELIVCSSVFSRSLSHYSNGCTKFATQLHNGACNMFYLFLHGPTQLLNLLAFVALTRADYWIDDSNTSALTYGFHPGAPHAWTTWSGNTTQLSLPLANGTGLTVVHTSCYNNS
jgi:hypothetical protein